MKKSSDLPKCFDDANKATMRLEEMFVGVAQESKIRNGQKPAQRAVFRKLHGVAHGRFEMVQNVPKQFELGVFTHQSLDAWVRFSSDTAPTSSDLKTTLGIGIKLFGVPGKKALGDEGNTADFIMQNHPVFFVDNAQEMAEFTFAGVVAKDNSSYLKAHPKTADIIDAMAKVEGSVLTANYWAILPFHAGENHYVKYRLVPETPPENIANNQGDYLATDMARRLAQKEYRFRFMVQLRTNPETMPLDEATVEWPEDESPFEHIATLVLPKQDICALGQAEYGQGLDFNIWRVPEEQRPTGTIADARKVVYAASAYTRHEANGQPLQDPICPRSAHPRPTEPDNCIVQAAIYPSIGVARVGSSPDEWFIGPEVPDPQPFPEGFYRDKHKKLKRQAARFRVYGLNTRGEIVRELTAEESQIEWKVQLANHKSAWYSFQLAQDIPEAASAPPSTLRNPSVADRSNLSITPNPHTIKGANAKPKAFDDGQFMGKKVYLGEIQTDEAGRLIVLGGHGVSASYDGSRAITFGNNEGWHDDISDGPVTAKVVLDGRELVVKPAWIVVSPPNYGPQRKSVRTMWDLMRDVAIKAGTLGKPDRPSFTQDIQPIFERLAGLQWVNEGFAAGFGWKGAFDLTSPQVLARLSNASGTFVELRRSIANQFRNYAVDSWSPKPWPWIYGDAMSVPAAETPRQNACLTDTQLEMLAQWAEGNFIEDYDPAKFPPTTIDDVPLAQRGDTLTKAALDFCLADAFHPGCEMTWPVRTATMYMEAFRFRHVPEGWIAPPPDQAFTSDDLNLPNGPLAAQQAGGITRWMAVPWQTDTASCRSGYDKSYDPYVPSFWPARVPNQVLTKENYEIVCDTTRPLGERMAAFASRAAWINPLGSTSYTAQINNMIAHFDHLGVVEVRKGPPDHENFPVYMEVEDQHVPIHDVPLNAALKHKSDGGHVHVGSKPAAPADSIDLSLIEKVRRFPRGLGN